MLKEALVRLQTLCTVTERDVTPWQKIDKGPMHFRIKAYDLEGIGRMSIVTMRAMFGLMKMETIVLTPLEKDMPLLSYDLIQAAGNDVLLLELYDTQLQPAAYPAMDAVKAAYVHLPDNDLGSKWYDHLKLSPTLSKKGRKLANAYAPLCLEWLDAYIAQLAEAPECDRSEKQEKVRAYVDGLFANGGPSTDQFRKLIGDQAARGLFGRFIFSSED